MTEQQVEDGYWIVKFKMREGEGKHHEKRVVEVRHPWVFVTGDSHWYKPEHFKFYTQVDL